MTLPAIKRSTANRLAKYIRDQLQLNHLEKEYWVKGLAKFFKGEDPLFRDDVFINVATGKLTSDPAIKNPSGKNQWSPS